MSDVVIIGTKELDAFTFRWPDAVEHFERGWESEVTIDGARHVLRHGIGSREVYGRIRVHTVTWLDGNVQVEGVEADDYPTSASLLSRLRRAGRATVRTVDELPAGYDGFDIVQHRAEIDARYSPRCLAVKIAEDDQERWALHAWLRSSLPRKSGRAPASVSAPRPVSVLRTHRRPTAVPSRRRCSRTRITWPTRSLAMAQRSRRTPRPTRSSRKTRSPSLPR